MNMKFRMYGYFSDYSFEDDPERSFDVHRNNYFEGEIDMNEDGAFVGKLRDHVGLSDIKGVLDRVSLSFTKVYYEASVAYNLNKEIKYFLLMSRMASFGGRDLPGCWIGTFSRQKLSEEFVQRLENAGSFESLASISADNARPGYASCTMYPLLNQD